MKKHQRHFIPAVSAILAMLMTFGIVLGCTPADQNGPEKTGEAVATEDNSTPEPEKAKVIAHWKLQDADGCYTGSVDDDSIGFKDLSGNGNDLIVKTAGNGDQLDIFSWDRDVDPSVQKFSSGLKFNNTKALAATVDPYKASETAYSGGYTSGKYLETVKTAPINSYTFPSGVSVEVIFKLSPELDNDYNRYTGLFSRQGVIEEQNEPPFSIAISEWNDDNTGVIGENKTWLQLLIMNDFSRLNTEMDEILIGANEWHHVLVTLEDTGKVFVWLDGVKLYEAWSGFAELHCTNPNFSWEVGVGRKSGTDHASDSKNENVAEGMIRRLFAGTIAEIRMLDRPVTVEESLYPVEFQGK